MTQEEANKIFSTPLGQQLSVIYVTSDDKPFIRYSEAVAQANGEMNDQTSPLANKLITEWYPDE